MSRAETGTIAREDCTSPVLYKVEKGERERSPQYGKRQRRAIVAWVAAKNLL